MKNGLSRDFNPTASLKMLPTFVRSIPDGSGEDCVDHDVPWKFVMEFPRRENVWVITFSVMRIIATHVFIKSFLY